MIRVEKIVPVARNVLLRSGTTLRWWMPPSFSMASTSILYATLRHAQPTSPRRALQCASPALGPSLGGADHARICLRLAECLLRPGGIERCDPGPGAYFAFFCCRGSAYAATSLDNTFFHDGKATTLSPRGNDIGVRRYPQATGVPFRQLLAGASSDCCCGRHSQRRPVHIPPRAAIHSAKRDKPTVPAADRNANLGIKLSGPLDCSINDFLDFESVSIETTPATDLFRLARGPRALLSPHDILTLGSLYKCGSAWDQTNEYNCRLRTK